MSKATRRALATADAQRLYDKNIPLIQDTTELITPDKAREMLEHNHHNRPVNWQAVEKLADIIRRGEWQIHAQGIILDGNGNILTGQTRLWAVIYAETAVYMRVSRGTPPAASSVIDRGRPQSARDLASRRTERKHSPQEASIARCIAVARGIPKPALDDVAAVLTEKTHLLAALVKETKGGKKTKSALMILGAACQLLETDTRASAIAKELEPMTADLDTALMPYTAQSCWGKGAAFGMAMERALAVVRRRLQTANANEKKQS